MLSDSTGRSKRLPQLFSAALCLAWAGTLAAQRPPAIEELLRSSGLRVSIDHARPRASREIRLHWRGAQDLQYVSHTVHDDPPPRQRSAELSPDHLVVAILDAGGVVRHTQILIDPRLVRGEFPDEQGNLHRNVFYRSDVEFTISVPEGVDAFEVRLLSPSWGGNLRLSHAAGLRLPEVVRQ